MTKRIAGGALGCAALMMGAGAIPATAQTAQPRERNMLTWPMPDTVSPQGRAVAA